jgi:hypothetical protein
MSTNYPRFVKFMESPYQCSCCHLSSCFSVCLLEIPQAVNAHLELKTDMKTLVRSGRPVLLFYVK